MELLCNFKLNHETFIADTAIVNIEMAADVREEVDTNVDAFDAAAEEWNNVTEITPGFGTRDNVADHHGGGAVSVSPLVTVDMVTQHLSSHQDMEQYLAQVRPGVGSSRRRGVRRWLCCLTSPPSLPPHLRQTVRLVQATALIALSNEEPLHLAMLRTIYRQLTSTTLDCPRSADNNIYVILSSVSSTFYISDMGPTGSRLVSRELTLARTSEVWECWDWCRPPTWSPPPRWHPSPVTSTACHSQTARSSP